MFKNLHFRTNFYVCLIIIIGFVCTSIISFKYQKTLFSQTMETTAILARDELQSKIEATLTPVQGMVQVMANDSFLRETIANKNDKDYKEKIFNYLEKYYTQYSLLHAYIVSEVTGQYFNSGKQTGKFTDGSNESRWYRRFLEENSEDILYIEPTIYNGSYQVVASTKIVDNGEVLGIVGVRTMGQDFFDLFKNYYDKYKVKCSIVDKTGRIVFSYSASPDKTDDLFGSTQNTLYKNRVFASENEVQFWYPEDIAQGFVASKYIPMLDMYLVAESSAFNITSHFDIKMVASFVLIVIVAMLVIVVTSAIFKKYNSRLIKATVTQEMEYQKLLQNTTEGLYENIFEYDITHNCASGEKTTAYFERIGLPKDAKYSDMLEIIGNTQIKPEFRQIYIDTFDFNNILEKFNSGIDTTSIDVMVSGADNKYRWIRVTARTFYWTSDQSVRMISYRENIDAQKCREKILVEQARCDSMTKLYNKFVTEEMIKEFLIENKEHQHALILCDIDNFKDVNDKFGHTVGDKVIISFAQVLKDSFDSDDIVGRVGGDEFAVLKKNIKDANEVKFVLKKLCKALCGIQLCEEYDAAITASLGAAIFPLHGTSFEELTEKADEALYYAKAHGKNSYNIYSDEITGDISSHVSQRDMMTLIENASDGISKIAYTGTEFKILYFNPKRIEMVGITAQEMSAEGYDVLTQYEPESRARVYEEFARCFPERKMFSFRGRLVHKDGHSMEVSVRGVFVNELYEGKYPVFYDMFTVL